MNKALSVLSSCLVLSGFLCGQTITVTRPEAGEILDAGHGYVITWTKPGPGRWTACPIVMNTRWSCVSLSGAWGRARQT